MIRIFVSGPQVLKLKQCAPSVTFTFHCVQPSRGLRKMEKPTLPETGQKWMVRVLEKAKQPVCSESLQHMARKLQYLETKGCKPYQILEFPGALTLSNDQIVSRVRRLNAEGVQDVSIPLLKVACGPRYKLKKKLDHFLSKRKGFLSFADFIKEKLECSEEELMELVGKNPRLLTVRSMSLMEDKINMLLEHGASVKDIRRHSHVLKNRTLDIIRRRAVQLTEIGCNNPLPVKWIMAGEKMYEKVVHNYKLSLQDHQEKNEFLHKISAKEEEVAHIVWNQRFRTLKPKISYLESKGFKVEDIVAEKILNLGLNTIKETYTNMEEQGIEDISMPILYHFAMFKRIRSKSQNTSAQLRQVISAKKDKLTIPPEILKQLFLQKRHVLMENYKFLLECGFSKESIQKLIIILGHDPKILHHQWSVLEEREELFPFESWKQDEWKLLNVLQYYIEKERNFQQTVVLGSD